MSTLDSIKSWFHKHEFVFVGGERLEMTRPKKVFWVSIYQCECGEAKANASDMKWYMNLKSVELGAR